MLVAPSCVLVYSSYQEGERERERGGGEGGEEGGREGERCNGKLLVSKMVLPKHTPHADFAMSSCSYEFLSTMSVLNPSHSELGTLSRLT